MTTGTMYGKETVLHEFVPFQIVILTEKDMVCHSLIVE